ncbi:hypothetical protein [Halobaculum marinum]|uniref:PGF-CTERM protein n=1 Tax=Halobaculum marinum TaxID=3031996 RepID=A0ABD5WXU8_9EURY|nr:hypothetical protein [Halobaculum sp. DT55]
MSKVFSGRFGTLLAAGMVLMLAFAPALGAAVPTQEQRVNMNSDYAHNPTISVDKVIVEEHQVGEMGGLEWVNDSGGVETFDAELNASTNNSYSYLPTQVEDETLGAFPRTGDSDGNISALNSSRWTKAGANSTSFTVTDTSGDTATGVESVSFGTDGTFGAGDSAYAEFTLPETITDSPDKLYFQQVFDVSDLESGAEIVFEYRDAGGDARRVVVNGSADTSDAGVAANQTGEGFVAQPQSGELSVISNDDGSFDGVDSVRVYITDGDGNITVTGLNAEKSSQWSLGTERVDGEISKVTEKSEPGRLRITSMDSIGSWAADGIVHKKGIHNLEFTAELTGTEDRNVTYSKAEQYGGYEWKQESYYRLDLPSGYDLTYYGVTFEDEQKMIAERYALVEVAEGTDDTAFANITSWTDKTSLYSNAKPETTHTLDDTVEIGKTYVFHSVKLITADEKTDLMTPQEGDSGKGTGFWGSNNPIAQFASWVISALVAVGGIVGLKRRNSAGA